MNQYNPKIISVLTVVFMTAFLMLPAFAKADENDLVVNFESSPLFNEANFLPGSTVTRTVEVINNTSSAKQIITEAINVSNPDDFSGVLNLVVSKDDTEFYNGSLEEFFSAGEVQLSSVAGGGGSAEYNFSVSFSGDASNEYQTAELGFDILVGFKGEGGGESSGDRGGSGGGGGGGGGGLPAGLSILNETVETLDIETTSATIVWSTSYRSTSRVIYGTVSGVFDLSVTPNYGYEFSTAEEDTPALSNGVFSHSVTITGLTPGTTYYFRTVSHASPDSVSFERSFSTSGTAPVKIGGSDQQEISSSEVLGTQLVSADESVSTNTVSDTNALQSENKQAQKEDKENQNNFSAAIFSSAIFDSRWFWLAIVAALIGTVALLKSNKKRPQ
ncbi:MAG: hypothetical protein A3J46_05710 [Candidatus Yanofskybacteria bacterium RIFCSPHIGHO2_02_FULL_41_11]|uniref:Purple acid phosphatase N-terminal domain-containing protein n=1 Tax=Candidatus Yanofskybacteria bacterium RIFCSPHIGHO2_02_FULL_41_11 TaxID=1802675 RepID=A0A1F8F9L3_9BACT|nr:MAG: hypothetical protein A3J46_05710 [Candidatus Yanofskybacteria bacterium RIFCSPHIGHO2_02_FULL_41_11]